MFAFSLSLLSNKVRTSKQPMRNSETRTMFENHQKCRIWIFEFWLFPNSQNGPFFGIYNKLLLTQNVNVARFARNVEWAFSVIFKHRDSVLKLLKNDYFFRDFFPFKSWKLRLRYKMFEIFFFGQFLLKIECFLHFAPKSQLNTLSHTTSEVTYSNDMSQFVNCIT